MGPGRRPGGPAATARTLTSIGLVGALWLVAAVTSDTLTPPAGAQSDEDRLPGRGGIELVSQAAIVEPGDEVQLSIRLPGILAADDQLTLTVHDPVVDEDDFIASVDGQLSGVLATISDPLSDLVIDDFGRHDMTLGVVATPEEIAERGQIALANPGVYPVSIDLRTSSQQLLGRIVTHVVRTPPPADRTSGLGLVMVAAMNGEATPERTAVVAERLALLGSAATAGTATVTPSLLGAVASSDAARAVADAADRWRFTSAPVIDVDVAALSRAGLDAELATLVAQGDDVIASLGDPDPTALVTSAGLTADALDVHVDRGVRTVAVHRGDVGATGSDPLRAVVEIESNVGAVRAVVIDEALMAYARDPDPVLGAHRLAAHLAALSAGPDVPTITLDVSDDAMSTGFLSALVADLARLDAVQPMSLDTAVGGAPVVDDATGRTLQLTVADSITPTQIDLDGFRLADDLLAAYASMIRAEDAATLDELRQELLSTLGRDVESGDRQRSWQGIIAFVRAEAAKLDGPPAETIQLTAREARVPFSFRNGATYPVRVEVRVLSDKLTVDDFDDGESTTLLLEPGGVTRREFQLRAIASGSFPVRIEMYSPDGGLLLDTTTATVRATAPSGIGVLIAVGAAAFLVLWWIFDARRKRLARR